MIRSSKKNREKSKKMLLIIKNKKKPRLTVADPDLETKFTPSSLQALISLQPTGTNCLSSVDCGQALIWCDFILGRFLFSFIFLALGIK